MGKRKKNSRRDRRKRLRRRQENAQAHQRTFAKIVDEVTGALEAEPELALEEAEVVDRVEVLVEGGEKDATSAA